MTRNVIVYPLEALHTLLEWYYAVFYKYYVMMSVLITQDTKAGLTLKCYTQDGHKWNCFMEELKINYFVSSYANN